MEHNRKLGRKTTSFIVKCLGIIFFSSASWAQVDNAVISSPIIDLSPEQTEVSESGARQKIAQSDLKSRTIRGLRHVRFDTDSIKENVFNKPTPKPIELRLFGNEVVTVVTESVTHDVRGLYHWYGHLSTSPWHRVVILVDVDNKFMVGTIQSERWVYDIRPIGKNAHEILKIDPTQFPSEIHVPYKKNRRFGQMTPFLPQDLSGLILPVSNGGNCITFLVAYTTSAKDAVGGTTIIEMQISNAVDSINDSFYQSGITHRVYLVHTGELSYAGFPAQDLGTVLLDDILNAPPSSALSPLKAWREQYKADVVSLWVEDTSTPQPPCAVGYLTGASFTFDPPNPLDYKDSAYSVVVRLCAQSNKSFAHELGHMMGALHDRVTEQNFDVMKDNFGHCIPSSGGHTGTIMAKADGCPVLTRLWAWSNPSKFYPAPNNTLRMGQFKGQTGAADNHRVFNDVTGSLVAGFQSPTDSACPGSGDTQAPVPPANLRVQ